MRGGLEAAVKSPPSPRERRRPDVTWVRRRGRCVVQEALGSWEGMRNPPPAGRHHRGRPVCGAPAAPQTPWLEQGLCHWQSSQAASRGPQLPINLGDYKGFAVGVSAPLLREETWCLAQGHSSTCPPPPRSAQGPQGSSTTPPNACRTLGRGGPCLRTVWLSQGPQPGHAPLGSPGRQPEHLLCTPTLLWLALREWGRGPKTTDLDVRGWVGGLRRG